jgi:ubiquinone/menaquinone biosynthesis C-methylase UbiE
MGQQPIRFDDGAGYERAMGVWSRLAGTVFLDWLAPQSGLRWIDVGCGNGAFTELVVQRHAPREMHGIDPSDAQLEFAHTRPALAGATLSKGDAMALPYEANRFDAATMALVIFFVPDPKVGVAEMKRVVRPGGAIAAYAWDILNPGGFPFQPVGAELRAAGLSPPMPPSAEISRFDAMRALWSDAGLQSVEMREITVERTFADFDEFWTITTAMGALKAAIGELPAEKAAELKARVKSKLPPDSAGRITYSSRANAVKGVVPV